MKTDVKHSRFLAVLSKRPVVAVVTAIAALALVKTAVESCYKKNVRSEFELKTQQAADCIIETLTTLVKHEATKDPVQTVLKLRYLQDDLAYTKRSPEINLTSRGLLGLPRDGAIDQLKQERRQEVLQAFRTGEVFTKYDPIHSVPKIISQEVPGIFGSADTSYYDFQSRRLKIVEQLETAVDDLIDVITGKMNDREKTALGKASNLHEYQPLLDAVDMIEDTSTWRKAVEQRINKLKE